MFSESILKLINPGIRTNTGQTNKYPDNEDYKSSCQPALFYWTEIGTNMNNCYGLQLLRHSHDSGDNGTIKTNLSTISTALEIK